MKPKPEYISPDPPLHKIVFYFYFLLHGALLHRQGDQVGRIFALWAIFSFRRFLLWAIFSFG
jgi:hypothetical protein